MPFHTSIDEVIDRFGEIYKLNFEYDDPKTSKFIKTVECPNHLRKPKKGKLVQKQHSSNKENEEGFESDSWENLNSL